MNVDAMRVGGGGGGYNLDSANPFGNAGPAQEAKADGPLEEILVSKNWKIRNAAYQKLTKEFKMAEDEKSKIFGKYTGFFKKMLLDTNPAAQAEATEAVKIFVDRAHIANKCGGDILPHLVKKALASNKASTKANTREIFSLFFELGCGEEATKNLVTGMKQGNFKIVLAALNIAIESMKEFGPKHVQYKQITAVMPTLFNHKKGEVRESVQQLACEMYGFVGPAFHEQVKNFKGMRSATLEAIATAFESVNAGGSQPTKCLRSEQGKKAAGGGGKGGKAKQAVPDDGFSFIDAVDITKELSKNWEKEVQAPKWKDKKAKLEELLKLASAPKIKDVPMIHDITRILKKLLKDSNIIVRSFSIKCLEALAKGLRKDYKSDAAGVLENLLPWFKEKKMSVLGPLNACMDAFFQHCLSWSDLKEPIIQFSGDKVPQVRLNILNFCIRSIKSPHCNHADLKKHMFKPLVGACIKLTADKDKNVRASAMECIAYFIVVLGDRTMYPVMAKIEGNDKKKHASILELSKKLKAKEEGGEEGKGAVTESASQPAPSAAAATPAAPSPEKKAVPKKSPRKKPALRSKSRGKSPSSRKKASTSKAASSSKSSKSKGTSIPAAKLIEYEDAKERLGSVFQGSILADLESKKWKERVGAVDQILELLKGDGVESCKENVGAIYSLFNSKPGWKDTNFQVCKKIFEAVTALIEACDPNATRSLCVLPLEDCLNKMSDRKIEPACKGYLTACCEAQGPKTILPATKEKLGKVRNPKAIAGFIGWVVTCIQEFGAGSIDVQQMIGYAKEWISHPHKDVRKNAMSIFVEIYKQTGKVLADKMLEGLKSAVAKDVQKAFDKVPEEELGKVEATRAIKGQAKATEVKMDDIVPRVDISNQVNDSLLSKFNDKKWQLRKEAMEDVEGILKGANMRIKGKDGGLFSALKLRLADKNKNLIIQALKLISLLVEAMGSGSTKYVGTVIEALLTCFADRKSAIRDEAVRTLIAFMKAAGLPKLVPYLPKGLEQTNARADILTAVNPALEAEPLKKSEMRELTTSILKCLLDRTKEVRTLAEVTLKCSINVCGYKHVSSKLTAFKKAEVLSLNPILEKYRGGGQDLLSEAPPEPSSTSTPKKASKTSARGKSSRSSRTPAKESKRAKAAPVEDDLLEMILKCSVREKEKRAKRDARRMKGGDGLDPSEIDDMKEALAKYTSPDFDKQLMHKNFPEFSKAISKIEAALSQGDPKVFERVVGILDLLLKWVSYRLCDGKLNTKVCKTLLKFLQTLTSALAENEYELLEGEAKNLLPYLLEKVSGHSMAAMREQCHTIVQKLCNVYPASRIIQELSDAMESKSKKVQAECLMEIGNMVARYGVSVSASPKKTVMMMGTCVGTSDKGLREAALVSISKVYQAIGCDKDKIWNYFGGRGGKCKLPKKNITMITERLKRIKPLPVQQPVPKPQPAKASQERPSSEDNGPVKVTPPEQKEAQPESVPHVSAASVGGSFDFKQLGLASNAFTLDFGQVGGGSPGGPSGGTSSFQYSPAPAVSAGVGDAGGTDAGEGSKQRLGSPRFLDRRGAAASNEYLLPTTNPHVLALDTPHVDDRVEALRQIWMQVQEQGALVFASDADILIEKIAQQIQSPYQMRLCKYALNTLMEFWQNVQFATLVSYDTLKSLMSSLLRILLDQELRTMANGDKVTRALNILTLKILENAQRTNAFGSLLELLTDYDGRGTDPFPGLCVKCLLKLTKVVPQTIQELNLRELISKIHNFFVVHPPYDFEDSKDMRLLSVKRLFSQLLELKGKEILSLALTVSRDPNSTIVRMCNDHLGLPDYANQAQPVPGNPMIIPRFGAPSAHTTPSNISPPPLRSSNSTFARPPPRPPAPAYQRPLVTHAVIPSDAVDDERTAHVAIIYKRLHQRDQAKLALEELYEFKKENPDYDLSPHMRMVSRPFQEWIDRGFKRIEERKIQRRQPTTSAAHWSDRLNSLKARAKQMKGGAYGSLSYGKSPPRSRSQLSEASVPAPSNPSSRSGGVAGSYPAGDIASLRSRLAEARGKVRAEAENLAPSSAYNSKFGGSSPGGSGSSGGGKNLDSIRARLDAMRTRK